MTVRRLLPLAALLAAAGLVLAQPPAKGYNPKPKKDAPAAKEPPKPAPGSLEDTLDKALRNSADIKAAEARVRNAEAELNQVRQQVLTKATALHADLNLAKRMLAMAEQMLAIQERSVRMGNAPAGGEGVLAAQAMIEKHRGEVEKLESELKSLRGEFALRGPNPLGVKTVAFSPDGGLIGGMEADGTVRVWDLDSGKAVKPAAPAGAAHGPMTDAVRQLLKAEVEFDATQLPVVEAVRHLLKVVNPDIPLRETLPADAGDAKVSLKGKLAVGAWMQAFEDSDPNIRIVVRDYGLLLTTRDRVPEGAVRVGDLWKGKE